ncbi:M23 family metallopeptidase [Phenylobacterium sp.]|jgi:murein DD-endopeptidase MepM/ murein hydrolase activator NlpD|uniref:M23 family metallopeptidase n=1 Tax=Phenylobacterium sp. TaxID=1871053 RepID=UPI002E2F4B3A|nr:M23 family metallopeptidase [Phenylobacterium sp.]HEX2560874.1 M23 family metallopeptidase [Phenylobacterium sp.]
MQEFDPRRQTFRFAPAAAGVGALAIALLAWKLTSPQVAGPEAPPALDPAAIAALQHQAFAAAEAQPGFTRPENVAVKILPGETFEAAVRRAGVAPDEARQAVTALGGAMDVVNIKAGLKFDAAVAKPAGEQGHAKLIGLSLRTGPASAITLSRSFDGALRLRELEEEVKQELTVADGEVHGSLYQSAAKLGATPTITGQMVKLFSHKVDFREIQPGDPFVLVFGRKVTESGRTVETGELEYAEFKGARFYRFERPGGGVEYFDESGKNIKGFLLRTPVDGARMTSRFGMRRHPILGYNRMHQGIDFGAGSGTPVFAAGDGVVVEARRWGGYGNWVRVRHANGWETGYAHLFRYGKGIKAGQRVRQGQVIAYVGSTGASTGPHLHYEVWLNGRRVNPVGAKVPQGTVLGGSELAAFKAKKAEIERLVAAKAETRHLAQAAPRLTTASLHR